jgi:hypothetical protein
MCVCASRTCVRAPAWHAYLCVFVRVARAAGAGLLAACAAAASGGRDIRGSGSSSITGSSKGWRVLVASAVQQWLIAASVLQQQGPRVLRSLNLVGPARGVVHIGHVHAGVLHGWGNVCQSSKCRLCDWAVFLDLRRHSCLVCIRWFCFTQGLEYRSTLPGRLT